VISAISSKPLPINNDMHGEKRPCINCGYCAEICPVDIMPQYAYKSIYADEIEEALAYGLLDCVECGLCSFVCPSKIDLSDYLIDARHRYHKELSQGV
jgi:Na+-transporting NADH:ubiquinone oxidoreductase subunit A